MRFVCVIPVRFCETGHFSFQSQLDRAIAKDPVLSELYFQIVLQVIADIEKPGVLSSIFNEIEQALSLYLNDVDIQKAGFHDAVGKPHSPENVLKVLRNRKVHLENRLKEMRAQVDKANTGSSL